VYQERSGGKTLSGEGRNASCPGIEETPIRRDLNAGCHPPGMHLPAVCGGQDHLRLRLEAFLMILKAPRRVFSGMVRCDGGTSNRDDALGWRSLVGFDSLP